MARGRKSGILWGAQEVAEFLGISYDTASKLMQSGKVITIPYRTLLPGSESTQLLTTKFNVVGYVAQRLNVPTAAMADFYKDHEPSLSQELLHVLRSTVTADGTNTDAITG